MQAEMLEYDESCGAVNLTQLSHWSCVPLAVEEGESSSPPASSAASNNPRSSNGTAMGTVCAAGAVAAKAQKAARAAFLKR